MRLALLALLGCLGCDQVFGLDRPPEPIEIPNAAPCRGPGEKLVLPLLADTYLDPGDDTPRGASTVLRVGDGRTTLLRFADGANSLQELAVTLTHASSAFGCGDGDACAACTPGVAGQLVMHLMRPDWDEATATQTQRTETEPWTMAGAAGSDRSNPLCTTAAYDGFDVTCRFMVASTDLAAWSGDLSVQLRSLATGTGVFGSREGLDQCVRTPIARAVATCRSVATCGNNMVDPGEGCDDGNTVDGDACSNNCTIETSMPVCGNDALETGESCDDSNTNDGDGCSATCTIEPLCGNGRVDSGEACDDGNTNNTDLCLNDCTCFNNLPCSTP